MSSLKEKNPAPMATKEKIGSSTRKKLEQKKLISMLEDIPFENIKNEKSGDKLFTFSQIEKLLNLTYPSGNFFINFDEVSYEFIGGCEKYRRSDGSIDELISNTQQMMNKIREEDPNYMDYVYNPIRDGDWFSKEKEVYSRELERLTTNKIVKKGIYKCPRCTNRGDNPNNTETEIMQTRAGDEILTVQNTCNTCGLSWTL